MTRRTLGDLLAKVPPPEERSEAASIAPLERPTFPRIVARGAMIGTERSKSEPPVAAAESTARLADEAYERGKRDGIAAVQADYDVKLAEQKALHVMKVASDRHRSASENAAIIAERLVGAMRELENEICGSVAAILAPFVAETVRLRAIEDLAQTLAGMIADRRPASLKVDGPADLLEALKKILKDISVPIEYAPVAALAYDPLETPKGGIVDSIEVRVRLDERIIRTDIGAWLERLRGAM